MARVLQGGTDMKLGLTRSWNSRPRRREKSEKTGNSRDGRWIQLGPWRHKSLHGPHYDHSTQSTRLAPAPPDVACSSGQYIAMELATPFPRVHFTSYIAHATGFEDAVTANLGLRFVSAASTLTLESGATTITKWTGDNRRRGCRVCWKLGAGTSRPLIARRRAQKDDVNWARIGQSGKNRPEQ